MLQYFSVQVINTFKKKNKTTACNQLNKTSPSWHKKNIVKRKYLFTCSTVWFCCKIGKLKAIDLWLQNAIFSVEIKRSPATAPVSIEKKQCDAFSSFSPALRSNFCLKMFLLPPFLIFFTSNFIVSKRPADLTAIITHD